MSIAQLAPSMTRGSSRWLLLGSLALNLFFVGVALAMVVRAPAPAPGWDRDAFVRLERLAVTLPAADADILRGRTGTNRAAIEGAQTKYRAAQGTIRQALRREPFDVEAMRAAMADARAARQTYDQAIQGVYADAAAQMSSAGRNALADWPPNRRAATK
jgi:uncharacterized membrane protein